MFSHMTNSIARPVPAVPTTRYNWQPLIDLVKNQPGQWFEVDGIPASANPSLIREGTPKVFGPPGSFDARLRKGNLYLVYLGEPIKPWTPSDRNADPRKFAELERRQPPTE